MPPVLSPVERRVLGSLIEKAATTPDTYPLSLNALVLACNQSSNRDPVMQLDDVTVMGALDTLRRQGLVRAIQPSDSRVMKYHHLLDDAWDLEPRGMALLGVLLLRGAQTPGELRTRTARLADFADAAQLEGEIETLIQRAEGALVVRLPRRPGQKELRYADALGGADEHPPSEGVEGGMEPAVAVTATPAASDRMAALEEAVTALRGEVEALRLELSELRRQLS
jgi:uncharacterized protein